PNPGADEKDAVLSGIHVRTLWPLAHRAAERADALPSALALCRGETLRLLDRRELSRGLRPPRQQRHSFQPREPAAWRKLCDAEDHQRRRRDTSWRPEAAFARQSR